MFKTKIKNVLAVVLAFAGIGVGPIGQAQAAKQPHAKEEQAGKTDQERMLGNWFIINDDSMRKGEMWVISEDRILMYAKNSGANAHLYFHRLDAGQDPKQIDITVTKANGSPSWPIGIIQGIYVLAGDELRLCLGGMGKDRPTTCPEKPGRGELLILHRQKPGAEPPKAKEEQADATKEQEVLTPAEAIAQRPKESVMIQFKVGGVEAKAMPTGGFGTASILLRNWGSVSVRLMEPTRSAILRLGIEPQQ